MTTTANPGIHPSQTLRVIRLLAASYDAHAQGGNHWAQLYDEAVKVSADATEGIRGGMAIGEVPHPGQEGWTDWYTIQTEHLRKLVDEDPERVHICEGGPLDGKVYPESKAFLPVQCMMPRADAGRTSGWPDAWPADVPRYMPHWTASDEPVRMVWTVPGEAEQVYPRPVPADHDDEE